MDNTTPPLKQLRINHALSSAPVADIQLDLQGRKKETASGLAGLQALRPGIEGQKGEVKNDL